MNPVTDKPMLAIGLGRTAEVFALPDGTVLKLLRLGFEHLADAEALVAAWLSETDVPAPRLIGRTRVGERSGLVFERAGGPSMQERLIEHPWELTGQAHRLARLHASLHETSGAGLPRQRLAFEQLIENAGDDLPPNVRSVALTRLARLPDGRAICHGDVHPGNVRLSDTGPMVVDWTAATCGEPAADVARTVFLLRHGLVPRGASLARTTSIAIGLRMFLSVYMREYRRLRPMATSELDAWSLVVLAAWVGKKDPGERPLMIKLIDLEMRRAL